METNWNQLIDRYVSGELSADGKAAFEQMCATNHELEASLQAHLLIVDGLKRSAQRNLVREIGKTYHRTVRLKWIAGIAIVLLIASGIVYWLVKTLYTDSVNIEQMDAFPTQTSKEETIQEQSEIFVAEVNDSTEVLERAISAREVHLETGTGTSSPVIRSASPMNNSTSNDTEAGRAAMNNVKEQKPQPLVLPQYETHSGTEKEALQSTVQLVTVPMEKDKHVLKKYPMTGANEQYQLFSVDGKYGMLDSAGTVLFEPVYDSIVIFDFSYANLVKAEKSERIFFRVKSIHYDYKYYIKVLQNNKWFLYTSDIRLITPDGFDELVELEANAGLLKVRKENVYGLIDYSGKIVLPIEYDDIYENHGLKARKGDQVYKLNPQKIEN